MNSLSCYRHTGQLHFVPPVGPLVFKICSFCWLLPLYLGDGGAVYNSTVDSCFLAVYLLLLLHQHLFNPSFRMPPIVCSGLATLPHPSVRCSGYDVPCPSDPGRPLLLSLLEPWNHMLPKGRLQACTAACVQSCSHCTLNGPLPMAC